MLPRSQIDFDALQRDAHEMRRQAVGEMLDAVGASLRRLAQDFSDLVRSVQARMRRAQDVTFFEAQ